MITTAQRTTSGGDIKIFQNLLRLVAQLLNSNNNYLLPTTNWVVQAQVFVLTRKTTSQPALRFQDPKLNQSFFESYGNTFTA